MTILGGSSSRPIIRTVRHFTTYPEIFALLMSRDLRAQWMAELPPAAISVTTLPSITREYSLVEIATMTRAAPAKLLGLTDRGHLKAGAVADVAVYDNDDDRAKMFRAAAFVFKDGELVVRDGSVIRYRWGRALTVTAGARSARSIVECGPITRIVTGLRWSF